MWYIGWITSNELYTFLNFVQNWFIVIYDSRPLYHLRSNLNPAKLNQSEMSFYEKSNKRKNDAMFFFQKYAMISHASLEGLSMITMFERRARVLFC